MQCLHFICLLFEVPLKIAVTILGATSMVLFLAYNVSERTHCILVERNDLVGVKLETVGETVSPSTMMNSSTTFK